MLFLMFAPPEGGMRLELEIESALVRMKPSPEGTSYQVCLACETPDEDFELDLNIIPLGSHQFPASEPPGNGIFHLQSHHNILWQHTYLISL